MFYNKIMAQYMRDECRKMLVQSLKHIKNIAPHANARKNTKYHFNTLSPSKTIAPTK